MSGVVVGVALRLQIHTLDIFPRGLYIENAMEVAREELKRECNYVFEAENQRQYKALVGDSQYFVVPDVVSELSTTAVLTTEFVAGVPLDQVGHRSGRYVRTYLVDLDFL